jgi:hypothetical protein
MSRILACLSLAGLALSATPAIGQARDSLAVASDSAAVKGPKKESRFYYGGSLGLSLYGNLLWMTVQPLVGYKLTPKTSLGTRLTCQYVRDRRGGAENSWFDYGGSLFSRYRLHPRAYLHAEFEYMSLDLGDDRELVPFLLLGGGYAQPLAPKTVLTIEVLVDVLRDERGRFYQDRNPRVNVGIGVGY